MTYAVLIDTCVWLDLASNAMNMPVVSALEESVKLYDCTMVVPELVREEFLKNKPRVIQAAQKSLKSHFRLLKNSIERVDGNEKDITLKAIEDADRRVKIDAQEVSGIVERIEALMDAAESPEVTQRIQAAVTARALEKRAPFHRDKNNAADAVLIELYASLLDGDVGEANSFAFITHNYRDFSASSGDRRIPHDDLNPLFARERSSYWMSVTDFLNDLDADLLADHSLEFEGFDQSRRLAEILETEGRLFKQVWYNRHWNLRAKVESGEIEVVSAARNREDNYPANQIADDIWKMALEAAKKTEDEVGLEDLGPWTDFEWGMINGKLSALRWVLGDEWDMLDT